MIPLLSQSVTTLVKHKKQFTTKLKKDDGMREQIKKTMEQGLKGIDKYLGSVNSLITQMNKNKRLTNNIVTVEEELNSLDSKMAKMDTQLTKIEYMSTNKHGIQQKIDKIKQHYQEEIQPMNIREQIEEIRDQQQ